MNHSGLKGFKELKCCVARAEEKLNAMAGAECCFLPTQWEMDQEEMPRCCGSQDFREAVSGQHWRTNLSWFQETEIWCWLIRSVSPWAAHTGCVFEGGFLPSLGISRSKPKGTSVWAPAHQETNLVSISAFTESLATEEFKREAWW